MNLINVEEIVSNFIDSHKDGINTIHFINLHNNDELSKAALSLELKEDLKTGCVTFINKYDINDVSGLNAYLFYIVNDFYKKRKIVEVSFKKKPQYVCPSCLYLGTENIIYGNYILICSLCQDQIKTALDPKKIFLCKSFALHNKAGHKCLDCKRFISHPLDGSQLVSCPYPDCCFVGNLSLLKKMSHPTSSTITEVQVAPEIISTHSEDIKYSPDNLLEIKDTLEKKISLIQDIIENQINTISYHSSEFTVKHKLLVYQAISNLLVQNPQEMTDYLLDGSRMGGFQHKMFQEYIRLLEKSLPFSFKKNKKIYKIESLLDEQLCLFDGISVFEGVVSDTLEIKNNTQETYIGGRKAAYVKPFYIGKLISILNKSTQEVLTNNVVEYTFSKIKLKNTLPNTPVIVTHLRIPPHYQMGGMVYINRIRKKIVDRALSNTNNQNE